MESLYRLCLRPAAVRVADQVSRQLLDPADRAQGIRADIDLEAWLRGSGVSLADMLSKLTLAGIATPDEARSFIGLPPAANGAGATLLRPVNMAPADAEPPAPAPAAIPAPANEAAAAKPSVILLDLAELRVSRSSGPAAEEPEEATDELVGSTAASVTEPEPPETEPEVVEAAE